MTPADDGQLALEHQRPTGGVDAPMLRGALELAELAGLLVAPAYHVQPNGRCSCGNAECRLTAEGIVLGSPGKHPRGDAWQQRASADPTQLVAAWSQWPESNVGIATGMASGVVVLDVDGEEGMRSLAELEARHGPLPLAPMVRTSRGFHLYFAAGSVPLHNRAGARGRGLGKGLDLRAEGGFVVAPPSIHASGFVYAWEPGRSIGELAPPTLPDWIVEAARVRPQPVPSAQSELPRTVAAGRAEKWAHAGLERECRSVLETPEGGRNVALNTAAFNVGMLVAGGALDAGTARRALIEAALAAGLGEFEALKTIKGAMAAGMKKDRRSAPTRDLPRSTGSNGQTHAADSGEPYEPAGPDESSVESQRPKGMTPRAVISGWANEGPLVRVSTGIEPLDRLCRGGLPIPWRVTLVGAPSAGKTFAQVIIAYALACGLGKAGACVGMLAVDEDPEDIVVRLLQIAGFSVEEAEARDPLVLQKMASALDALNIRFYDARHTIESTAADVAAWAATKGQQGALLIDGLQSVRAEGSSGLGEPRTIVEANAAAIRHVSTVHRLLVVATSEANRASYRDDAAAKEQNDLAAGAESRAIEFGCQTQLVLRTPKNHPDVVHVKVAKNRRADKGEFWLRLDRESHTMAECDDPAKAGAAATSASDSTGDQRRPSVEADARRLSSVVTCNPGCSERDLRDKVKNAELRWGVPRLEAAKKRLADAKGVDGFRLVDKSDSRSRNAWTMVPLGEDA